MLDAVDGLNPPTEELIALRIACNASLAQFQNQLMDRNVELLWSLNDIYICMTRPEDLYFVRYMLLESPHHQHFNLNFLLAPIISITINRWIQLRSAARDIFPNASHAMPYINALYRFRRSPDAKEVLIKIVHHKMCVNHGFRRYHEYMVA
ncbi:OLC1v1006426C1 [Oldenlandia corymbosa var. corymbosa]|uniref:OLC1v1006426C1 n=1 Tax=Oldenlandia corymbosa var. corymbosa TaxID=529605 RepID=A0AAV1DHA4_OLDCO|nr:OLC1v1006426C1 [Oldenlandia corymbosa var. corymbosa]